MGDIVRIDRFPGGGLSDDEDASAPDAILGGGGPGDGGGGVDTYSRGEVDSKFEALRSDIRASIADSKLDLSKDIAKVDKGLEVLTGQIKVWGLVGGLVISVVTGVLISGFTIVVNHFWK